jgi:hypothetical protein
VTLEAKEGLALINGTQPSTAVAALAATAAAGDRARRRHRRGALDRRAARLDAPVRPAHPRRAAARRAAASAANILALLQGSGINKSHAHCGRVQDAYSLRCAAQVHGAARDALAFAADARHRGQRRHRQPDGVLRERTRSSRAATSTARRWPSPPTCWPSRSRTSRRSASGVRIGSSTRRSATCRRS